MDGTCKTCAFSKVAPQPGMKECVRCPPPRWTEGNSTSDHDSESDCVTPCPLGAFMYDKLCYKCP